MPRSEISHTEKEFVENPDLWPRWPVLTMIERTTRECGIIWDGDPTTVILVNIWAIEEPLSFEKACEKYKTVKYDTVDQMLAKWRID